MIRVTMVSRICTALAAVAAAMLAPAAGAQQPAQPPRQGQGQGQGTPIGPPQLQDFDLGSRPRPATRPQPTPLPTPPAPTGAQPTARPIERAPAPDQPQRAAPARDGAPTARAPTGEAAPPPTAPAPVSESPAPVATGPGAPAPSEGVSTPAPTNAPAAEAPAPSASLDRDEGMPLWLILLGGLALGLIAYVFLNRRRAAARRQLALPAPETIVAAAATPAAPRVPRPDPVPRPWLEIELTPERTTADPEESVVEFELVIRNNGGGVARDIRLQAKLICSTPDQDKEIAAFHRKKPGEHRTLEIPDIAAGQELRLKGRVDVKREDIKALRMDQRLIWVPLVAVNAFYGWGGARTGQTSKSFLVGREQPEAKDKMAPFRLDLGPRVYRTVGQRPYKIERRV